MKKENASMKPGDILFELIEEVKPLLDKIDDKESAKKYLYLKDSKSLRIKVKNLHTLSLCDKCNSMF